MTADMRDQMAGTMVLVGGLSRAASTLPSTDTSAAHQQKQLAAQIGAVFAKHGVADEAFERDVERLDFRILAQDIHDKSRFLADMRAATLNDPLRKDGLEDEIQSSTLEGVTITGEIASATMVTPKRRHPIRFQKAGGIWKIDTNMLPWGDLSPQ
jgi:hypothetical protein